MKTIIKYLAAALTLLLLSVQVNAQGLPTPGAPPSINPTVPNNPPGLPPSNNFPTTHPNPNPPILPGSTGTITPPDVPGNTIKTTPALPATPGISGPTGTTGPTGPHGSMQHACNGSCNHGTEHQLVNATGGTEVMLHKP